MTLMSAAFGQGAKKLRTSTIVGIAAVVVCGALVVSERNLHSPSNEIVGQWALDITKFGLPAHDKYRPIVANLLKVYAFDFTSNGKFTFAHSVTGTYKLDGRNVLLHPESFSEEAPGDIEAFQSASAKLSRDGNTLTVTFNGMAQWFAKSNN